MSDLKALAVRAADWINATPRRSGKTTPRGKVAYSDPDHA